MDDHLVSEYHFLLGCKKKALSLTAKQTADSFHTPNSISLKSRYLCHLPSLYYRFTCKMNWRAAFEPVKPHVWRGLNSGGEDRSVLMVRTASRHQRPGKVFTAAEPVLSLSCDLMSRFKFWDFLESSEEEACCAGGCGVHASVEGACRRGRFECTVICVSAFTVVSYKWGAISILPSLQDRLTCFGVFI